MFVFTLIMIMLGVKATVFLCFEIVVQERREEETVFFFQ